MNFLILAIRIQQDFRDQASNVVSVDRAESHIRAVTVDSSVLEVNTTERAEKVLHEDMVADVSVLHAGFLDLFADAPLVVKQARSARRSE